MASRPKRTGDASSSTPPPTKKTKENQSALTREIFPERNVDLIPAAHIRRTPALDRLRECIVSQSLRNLACCNEEYNETLVREFYHRFPGGGRKPCEGGEVQGEGEDDHLGP